MLREQAFDDGATERGGRVQARMVRQQLGSARDIAWRHFLGISTERSFDRLMMLGGYFRLLVRRACSFSI